MSAPTLSLTVRERPPTIPAKAWPHMSHYQQARAIQAWHRAHRDAESPDSDKPAQAAASAPPAGFTREEMLAGNRAYDRWIRHGKSYELSDRDRAAWRAYQKASDRRRRSGDRVKATPVSMETRMEKARLLAEAGDTPAAVASAMGIKPKSLERQLLRSDAGREVLAALRRNRDAR